MGTALVYLYGFVDYKNITAINKIFRNVKHGLYNMKQPLLKLHIYISN